MLGILKKHHKSQMASENWTMGKEAGYEKREIASTKLMQTW